MRFRGLFIGLLCLLMSCATAQSTWSIQEGDKRIYYYNDIAVSADKKPVVKAALEEIQNKIPCISFRPIKTLKGPIDQAHVLFYVAVPALPGTAIGAEANYVGLQINDLKTRIVLVAENDISQDGTLYKLADDYYFKLVIHETAHALGMPPHPFTNDMNSQTILAPQVSLDSSKSLSRIDVNYLDSLVCKGNKT